MQEQATDIPCYSLSRWADSLNGVRGRWVVSWAARGLGGLPTPCWYWMQGSCMGPCFCCWHFRSSRWLGFGLFVYYCSNLPQLCMTAVFLVLRGLCLVVARVDICTGASTSMRPQPVSVSLSMFNITQVHPDWNLISVYNNEN